jgi:glycosyltransferase involved in cell wall biosynthesis
LRLVFLNRFYWPDEPATAQLLTDLAESLAAAGHEVAVITSHPGRDSVPAEETHHGVRILRVRSPRSTRAGLLGKAATYAAFYVGALWRAFRLVRRADTLVALTDPPLIGVGAWFISALRGARLIHWVQDIYPEVAIELAGQRWLRILTPLRNLAWRRAAHCVTLGSDMAALLTHAGVPSTRISLSPNWPPAGLVPTAPAAAADLRAEWGLTGKFVVAYSGNLGRVHDLEPVLAVAAALRAEPDIVFVFIGAGAQRASLEAEATRRGLTNIQFRPPQPRARLAETLAVGDVHLVTLLPGCERLVFPSKLYGVAAVGRPVVFIGPRDCELARLVVAHHFGLAFTRDATAAIAASLRQLRDSPGRCTSLALSAAQFGEKHSVLASSARWLTLLPHSPLRA